MASDVYIVPPEIANPGGVFGSALEMASSREGIEWVTEAGADRLAQDKMTHREGMRDMFVNILGTNVRAVKDANGYHARNHYVESAGVKKVGGDIDSAAAADMRAKEPSSSQIDLTKLI